MSYVSWLHAKLYFLNIDVHVCPLLNGHKDATNPRHIHNYRHAPLEVHVHACMYYYYHDMSLDYIIIINVLRLHHLCNRKRNCLEHFPNLF